jgi:hypothetical protein
VLPVHAFLQAPQLVGLFDVSTHVAPQSSRSGPQGVWHVFELHTMPIAQALLHPPQFAGSDCTSVQPPLHAVSPAGQ